MPLPHKKLSSAESLSTISNVLISAFIIGALYFGQDLLVPLALASLLTFLLAPVATKLQRWIGRVGSVLCLVAMIFVTTGVVGWVITRQVVDLANELPSYKENIRSKLRSIQLPADGPFSRVSDTIKELKKDVPGSEESDSPTTQDVSVDAEPKAMPVEIVNSTDDRIEFAQVVLAPVLGPLGTVGLVLLLLIFMLLQREDLRNRMIRLVGQGRLSVTSQAMDDAGSRVSKYLLMQLVINVTYGIPVAVGLYFIGVPNAILWGALATVLRFIPYVGPWIAASFPIILSLAVSPNWTTPLLTISLFIVLELFSNNVMEPMLYGSSTGVTPIALIVAALVWTLLWGPVGLVLATPLTVCLVVMGRHIPKLAFFSILLSDDEPLTPAEECYHRLHRTGEHDGMDLVENYLKANPVESLYDSVLIPVITMAERDHRLGLLDTEQLVFIEQGLSDVLDDLELRQDVSPLDSWNSDGTRFRICSLPARAHRDELAGRMFVQLLHQTGHPAQNGTARMVSGELIGWVRETQASVVCISVVPPSTVTHARYLVSKLRKNFPSLKIIVGLWGHAENDTEIPRVLRESGADDIVFTLAEAADRVARYAPVQIVEETDNLEIERIPPLADAAC